MENKLSSVRKVSNFLGVIFFVNLISAIILLFIGDPVHGDSGIISFIETLLSLITSFVLWRTCSYIYSTLQYLFLTKEDKPAGVLNAEAEVIENYSDHR